jgi:hypothetical protein
VRSKLKREAFHGPLPYPRYACPGFIGPASFCSAIANWTTAHH